MSIALGQPVRIKTQRPHVEQYNGFVGQVATITNADIVYVVIGRSTPCFYMDEIETIAPVEGGVQT